MQYVILVAFLIVIAAGFSAFIIVNEIGLKQKKRNDFFKQYSDRRFQICDKVIINHDFYDRPGCFGIVEIEHREDFEDITYYAYTIKVFMREKQMDNIRVPGSCLQLVIEDSTAK